MTTPLLNLPLATLVDGVQGGTLSAEQVTQACLQAIAQRVDLNAFITVGQEQALAAARALDLRRAKGERLGALAGVPIAVKDALCTADMPTTAASRILTRAGSTAPGWVGWQPPYDATAVERLRRADAIVIGKTNMDEFAMGSSNENSAFGPVRHPLAADRIPGGSSGGSAVSVAARLVPASLGSDTGGSIRQPAALCGVVGIKPSYGRVSRHGLIAFASSLDQVGPFAADVRSAARLLAVIAGPDARDSTCSTLPADDYEKACDEPLGRCTIGVPEEYFAEGLDPEVRASVERALQTFTELGCSLKPVSMPHTRYGIATYYILATAEASSNLARFDGVRFGFRSEAPQADLQRVYCESRGQGFGPEVKRRIMLGTYVLSAGYYDAYYGKAQKARALIRRDFDAAFTGVDVIATPCTPTPAFELGEKLDDPLQMYLSDAYSLPASLAGVCGLSLPIDPVPARADRPALPVGLQLLAPAFAEGRLLTVAAAYEATRSR